MLYKLSNNKNLFFIIICFSVLCIDFYFFNSVFDFKRHMIEKYGFIHLFLLPILITWFLFSIIDKRIIKKEQ